MGTILLHSTKDSNDSKISGMSMILYSVKISLCNYQKTQVGDGSFEKFLTRALHTGVRDGCTSRIVFF